jgi:hypothetical protein
MYLPISVDTPARGKSLASMRMMQCSPKAEMPQMSTHVTKGSYA